MIDTSININTCLDFSSVCADIDCFYTVVNVSTTNAGHIYLIQLKSKQSQLGFSSTCGIFMTMTGFCQVTVKDFAESDERWIAYGTLESKVGD